MRSRLDPPTKGVDENGKKYLHIQVGEHVYDKIHNHVRKLKYLKNQSLTKRAWIHEAIREKLDREKSISDLPRKKYLSITIDSALNEELEKRMLLIRKFVLVSKKSWVLEALLEKLERDYAAIKELSEDLEICSRSID